LAQEESVHAVHVGHVPLLPKISAPEVDNQAPTMYFTVVPPGCAGRTALGTSTI
jgi:hypothetical protein